MQTTMKRYRTSGSRLARNLASYPDDTAFFVRRFAPQGRDPAQADENLYRYCGNEPAEATDPSGLAVASAGQLKSGVDVKLKSGDIVTIKAYEGTKDITQRDLTTGATTTTKQQGIFIKATSKTIPASDLQVVQMFFRLFGSPDSKGRYTGHEYQKLYWDPKNPDQAAAHRNYQSSTNVTRPDWILDSLNYGTITATAGNPNVDRSDGMTYFDAPGFLPEQTPEMLVFESFVLYKKGPFYRIHWEVDKDATGKITYPTDAKRFWGIEVNGFPDFAMKVLNGEANLERAPTTEGDFWNYVKPKWTPQPNYTPLPPTTE